MAQKGKKPSAFLAVCWQEQKNRDPGWAGELFSETTSLTVSAGMVVLNKPGDKGSTSRLRSIDARTYVASGTAAMVGEQARGLDADCIIFNMELSPSQQSNLEELCGLRILTRTELIYEIFLERSNSSVSRIQIELANLRYIRSRLTGSYKGMDRIRGGIGIKGPGETKLEIDRRTIGRRISRLKQELGKVEKHFKLIYDSRKDADAVSICGYTNAGKTSLMNALTGATERAENMLFSTVEVRTRRMSAEQGRGIAISDTIGFIRDLPHHLVESFKTTLMDIRFAKLILIVCDASSRYMAEHLRTVRATLDELDCSSIPSFVVCNKMDMVQSDDRIGLPTGCHMVSTKTGEGLDSLKSDIFGFFSASKNEAGR